jgi:hypothetical protein
VKEKLKTINNDRDERMKREWERKRENEKYLSCLANFDSFFF